MFVEKEIKYKPYYFKIAISGEITGWVFAEDEEQAKEFIKKQQWDEIEDKKVEQIEEIKELHEEMNE